MGLGDWVSVKVRFGWRIREVPYLQIQGEICTHSELLRTSGVRRGVGVNESVKKGHPGSQGELGSKGTVSGRVKAVVGSILVVHDGNRGLRSLKRRHGVGCEERCESGPEADCYLNSKLVNSRRLRNSGWVIHIEIWELEEKNWGSNGPFWSIARRRRRRNGEKKR